jgi:mRNA interferase RelE/StbE
VSGEGTWHVEVTGPAVRGLHRLPPKAAAAIVEFITGALAEDPHRLSKPLVNELAGMRSARRGDYRVILSLDEEKQRIYMHRIDHRADVYRPR